MLGSVVKRSAASIWPFFSALTVSGPPVSSGVEACLKVDAVVLLQAGDAVDAGLELRRAAEDELAGDGALAAGRAAEPLVPAAAGSAAAAAAAGGQRQRAAVASAATARARMRLHDVSSSRVDRAVVTGQVGRAPAVAVGRASAGRPRSARQSARRRRRRVRCGTGRTRRARRCSAGRARARGRRARPAAATSTPPPIICGKSCWARPS